MNVEQKLAQLGLVLPPAPTITLPFSWVRVWGNRAYIAGHGPLNTDGSPAGPFGKVGADLSVEEGYAAARAVGLAVLGSLQRELGDLDRVEAWLMVYGMVNAVQGFTQTSQVMNGFSDLILELYGPEAGKHARMSPGMMTLPMNATVVIGAEVAIRV